MNDSFVTISIDDPLLILLIIYITLGSIDSTASKSITEALEFGIDCCKVAITGQLTNEYVIRLIQWELLGYFDAYTYSYMISKHMDLSLPFENLTVYSKLDTIPPKF